MMLIEVISVTARDMVFRAIKARRYKPLIAVLFVSGKRTPWVSGVSGLE